MDKANDRNHTDKPSLSRRELTDPNVRIYRKVVTSDAQIGSGIKPHRIELFDNHIHPPETPPGTLNIFGGSDIWEVDPDPQIPADFV